MDAAYGGDGFPQPLPFFPVALYDVAQIGKIGSDAGSTPSSDEGSGVRVLPIGGVARGVTRPADRRQRPGASSSSARAVR